MATQRGDQQVPPSGCAHTSQGGTCQGAGTSPSLTCQAWTVTLTIPNALIAEVANTLNLTLTLTLTLTLNLTLTLTLALTLTLTLTLTLILTLTLTLTLPLYQAHALAMAQWAKAPAVARAVRP